MGSKGKGSRGRFVPPSGGSMLKQVQQLQAQMLQAQEELAQQIVEASVGGGVVKVVINGQQEVQSVFISPEAVDAAEVEMLQDLIVAAMNEALKKSRELAEQKMAPMTGALNLPGLL